MASILPDNGFRYLRLLKVGGPHSLGTPSLNQGSSMVTFFRVPRRRFLGVRTIFLVFFLLLTVGGSIVSVAATQRTTGTTILTAVLAHPRLAAYYHRDEQPSRFPLQIVNSTSTPLDLPDPAATGIQAILLGSEQPPDPLRAAIIVDAVSVTDNTAFIAFRFPVEGLSGKATLIRREDSTWEVTEMILVEH